VSICGPAAFPAAAVAVKLAVLTIRDGRLAILLADSDVAHRPGAQALPGGFVQLGEDLETAARRELCEMTGFDPAVPYLEQLRSYGPPRRNPGIRVVTVAYLVLVPVLAEPAPGSDAPAASWTAVNSVLSGRTRRASDCRKIVADAAERVRCKLEYTTVAAVFCGCEFTITDLRRVYEAVWERRLDPRNFHRKITASAGFLQPTATKTDGHDGRPASLYRRGPASRLHPPLLRSQIQCNRALSVQRRAIG
jgi:8-oxo-dGTP diphosphatase